MENSFGLGDVGVEVAQETTRNGVLVKCGPLAMRWPERGSCSGARVHGTDGME